MQPAASHVQPEKKLRPKAAGRRRGSSSAAPLPAPTETVTLETAPLDYVPVKSSRTRHTWSIRLSLLALHSSLLSFVSSLYTSCAAAAIQHWGTVCAFYHSLFPSSASRRRFVSRLRTLSHATATTQQQPLPVQRYSHSLRLRHHPLLERQKGAAKDGQPALCAGEEECSAELLMPRSVVLCMVLMCMFLGTVVVTFLVFNRGQ